MLQPQISSIESLFPEPLTPFEMYMLYDNKPDYPSSSSTELVFQGKILNRDLFIQAFQQATLFHPSYFARLVQNGNKCSWKSDTQTPIPLTFESSEHDFTQDSSGVISFDSFDIVNEPGLRLHVKEGKDSVVISFKIHHCLSDGVGMNAFIGSWLDCYAQLLDPQPDWEPYPFNIEQYKDRESLYSPPDKRTLFERLKSSYYNVGKWFYKKPWEIRNLPNTSYVPPITEIPQASEIRLPVAYWRTFDGVERAEYRVAADKCNVSMNTAMIRDLFLTLKQWSQISGYPLKKNELFRTLMPRNLRNEKHTYLPCTDLVGYTFMDRSEKEVTESQDLLDFIDERIRRNENTTLFLKALKYFVKFPALFKKIVSRKCLSTVVISNVGQISRSMPQKRFQGQKTIFVPGLTLVRQLGSPLCRPGTPISMGIASCGSECVIAFTIDQMHFNKESADKFMELYFQNLEKTRHKGLIR